MNCAKCGYTSSRPFLFKPQKGKRPNTNLCLPCDYHAAHGGEWLVAWLFLGPLTGGLVFLYASPSTLLGPILLNLAIFQAASLISLILHELGHVAGAILGGLKVLEINIGHGKQLFEFRTAGVVWTIRELPFSGFVLPGPTDPDTYKASHSVCILGGPLANALLLVFAVNHLDWDKALTGSSWDHVAPMTLLAIVNAVYLVCSLWPFPRTPTSNENLKYPDGALLFKTWRLSKEHIEAAISWTFYHEAEQFRKRKQFLQALEHFTKLLQREPGNITLQMYDAYLQIQLKQLGKARDKYLGLLEITNGDMNLQATILNNVAFLDLLLSDPSLRPEADDFSSRAIAAFPENTYYQATRGAVLLQLNQVAQGMRMLETAVLANLPPESTAINLCLIARAEQSLGNSQGARELFDLARRLDAECILLEEGLQTGT